MENLKIGDIVIFTLIPKSPKMRVRKLLDDNTIECCWFDKTDKLYTEKFSLSELKKYTPPKLRSRML